MDRAKKLSTLSDAAKYDASCSSSGSARDAAGGAIGNGAVGGICHTWAADGRCVSLLKVLLSNACAYDCAYCVNRRSNDGLRTGFEPEELVRLTLDFYRRNYIEGLFLSSAVVGCPDRTMERLIAVARILRVRERWNGYLHLKAIPGASSELVAEAARYADRLSVNIELPSAASLAAVAPDKSPASIFGVMRTIARASGFEPRRILPASKPSMVPLRLEASGGPATRAARPSGIERTHRDTVGAETLAGDAETAEVAERAPEYLGRPSASAAPSVMEARRGRYRNPKSAVLPAGQTTQMVVGASPESDADILRLAENLYLAYDVRRVYYSAFVPAGSDPRVPALPGPPLLREHRLYQADWLFRFYGFKAEEILEPASPFLDRELDPKCAWALRHLDSFPVELNSADYYELLRVPGIGPGSAARIVRARRGARLTPESVKSMGVVMKRAAFFITCSGVMPTAPGAGRPVDPDASYARRALTALERGEARPLQPEFDWTGALSGGVSPGGAA